MDPEPVEEVAELAHNVWARWMRYMFDQGHFDSVNHPGMKMNALVCPVEVWERWKRQMNASYSDLSEREKDSDRRIAAEYLDCIRKARSV